MNDFKGIMINKGSSRFAGRAPSKLFDSVVTINIRDGNFKLSRKLFHAARRFAYACPIN